MKKIEIVILGAGFAGLRALYRLEKEGKHMQITLIDQRQRSLEKPSLPELAFTGKAVDKVLIDIEKIVSHRNIRYLNNAVEEISPGESRVLLDNGMEIPYDYLLIATGAVKDYQAIRGFSEYGYSLCDEHQAARLWKKLRSFEGGNVLIGAAESHFGTRVKAPRLKAPCEGPIGEAMFMLEYELRQRGHRDKSPVRVFTPGSVFFEDVGDRVRNKVGGIMKERGIELYLNKVLREIREKEVFFADGSSLPSDLTIIIPPYKAAPIFRKNRLGDEEGFIPTDESMKHLDFDNIYAIGDINALAQPKLGHIAVHQADVAVSAILKDWRNEGEILPFRPEIFCIMNMGGNDATLIYSDVLFGGSHDLAFRSPLAHMMKWGFDSYYFYTKGHMPPDFSVEALEGLLDLLSRKKSK